MEPHQYNHNNWLTLKPYLLLALVLAALIFLQSQIETHDLFRYQRNIFLTHPEQSITHAFVHLNTQHLLLNATTLICLFILFGRAFQSFTWVLVLLFSAASSALGLYLFSPTTEWCLGLSGALHGLTLYVMLRSHAHSLWVLLLVLKISLEQIDSIASSHFMSITSDIMHYPVIVDAHLWGAAGGALVYIITRTILAIRVLIEVNHNDQTP